jgi:cytochrome P450
VLQLLLDSKTWRRDKVASIAGEIKGSRTVHALPTTLPILLNTWDLMRNLSRIHEWNTDNCLHFGGEPFVLRALGQPDMTNVCTPQAVEDVLKHQFDAFPKGSHMNDNVRDLLGHGIFAVDGDRWVHQRKTASRLFTMRALRESMTAAIRKHAAVLHAILDRHATSGKPVDLFRLFNRFTIEAFAEIGFGIHMGCLDSEREHPFQTAFDGAQRALACRFTRPSWFWKAQRLLGVGVEGELQRNIRVIDATVLDIIAKSLEHRHGRSSDKSSTKEDEAAVPADIVSLFLDTMDTSPGVHDAMKSGEQDQDAAFDPRYLRDIVVNFLIAGRDTTAQALSWFFYNVGRNPEVESKIVAELRAKVPHLFDGADRAPTMEQAGELVYLEAALRETLRLFPSVPFVNKKAARDVVLSDGTFIAGGSIVGIPMYAMGRLPFVWGEDAAQFKPERWIDAASGRIAAVSASKFVAFNAGPRTCLGMNLALLEMKLVAAGLLARLHAELVAPDAVTFGFSLTLPVKGDLLATISPRAQSAI